MEELTFIVPKGGRGITIEGHGFVGEGCKTASEAYERALGVVESVKEKPEFYMRADQEQSQEMRRA